MIIETYHYIASKNHIQYFFESDGVQGKILKVVLFTHIKEDNWNLGFGDWHKGEIDDAIISNNQDLVKVIGTVAQIATDYLEIYPHRCLVIKPIDEKRKRLYNHVFRRHFKEIDTIFKIIGYINGIAENYSFEKNYDSFELKRKFEI